MDFTRPAPPLSPSSSTSSLSGPRQGLEQSRHLSPRQLRRGSLYVSWPQARGRTGGNPTVLDTEWPSHPEKQATPQTRLAEFSPCWARGGGTHQEPGHLAGAQASQTATMNLLLHSTTSSICSTNSVTQHTGNVVEVRGDSEARGGQQPTQGPSNMHMQKCPALWEGGNQEHMGTNDYSLQKLP